MHSVTVTTHLPASADAVPEDTVISVVPSPDAVTTPWDETVATAVFADTKFSDAPGICCPFWSWTVAVTVAV